MSFTDAFFFTDFASFVKRYGIEDILINVFPLVIVTSSFNRI